MGGQGENLPWLMIDVDDGQVDKNIGGRMGSRTPRGNEQESPQARFVVEH